MHLEFALITLVFVVLSYGHKKGIMGTVTIEHYIHNCSIHNFSKEREHKTAICFRVNILAYQNSKERNLVRQLFCALKEKLLGQRKSFS